MLTQLEWRRTLSGVPFAVVANAQLTCTFGVAPSALGVLPAGASMVQAGGQLVATIMDFKPQVNIKPFGMCSSMANPQVASATAAAQGVLTPQPCMPVTTSPWTPGAMKVTSGGMKVLTDSSRCMCNWGGQISIVMAGQMKVQVS